MLTTSTIGTTQPGEIAVADDVFSVEGALLWGYKLMMALFAAWLVGALLKWVRWGWLKLRSCV